MLDGWHHLFLCECGCGFFAKDWMYMMSEINCRCSAGLFNSKNYTVQYVIFNYTLCLLDYFAIVETKFDESVPSKQFTLDNFEIRARKDKACRGGGLLEFVRKGFICKRQTHLQPTNFECICSELAISNIKWNCFLNSQNLVQFFNELSDSLICSMNHTQTLLPCSLFNLQHLLKKKLALQKHINQLLI